MGAKGQNFYNALVARYGYEAEAREIQELYLGGKKMEAIATVPDALVDEVALVGPRERIADRLEAWRESRRDHAARPGPRRRDAAHDGGAGPVKPRASSSTSRARSRSSPAAAAGSAARWRRASPRRAPTSSSAPARSSAARRRPRELEGLGRRALALALRRARPGAGARGRRPRPRRASAASTSSSTTPALLGRAGRGPPARGLAEGDRRQPDRGLPVRPGGRPRDDRAAGRQDREHRLRRGVRRRAARADERGRLQRVEGRRRRLHPRPRDQVGAARDQRERDRAGLVPLRHEQGAARVAARPVPASTSR